VKVPLTKAVAAPGFGRNAARTAQLAESDKALA